MVRTYEVQTSYEYNDYACIIFIDSWMDQMGQVKSEAHFLPHWLRRRVRSVGTLSLMPRMLALMAVQRHTVVSRSASPPRSGQHCSFSGTPILSFTRFSTSAHTPSFSVLIGQLPPLLDGTTGGGRIGRVGTTSGRRVRSPGRRQGGPGSGRERGRPWRAPLLLIDFTGLWLSL
ncbi:hypothetical protein VPH35_139840 [Triticum aestivum]